MTKRALSLLAAPGAAAAIMVGLGAGASWAQPPMASPVQMPNITMPQPAPNIQPMPSYNAPIQTVPDSPSAVAAPPQAVEAAPVGTHYTPDGKLGLDPGCHWVSDAADDVRTYCN